MSFRWYSALNKKLDAIPPRSRDWVPPPPRPSVIWRWVNPGMQSPWWMSRAYYDPQRDHYLYVAFPLHAAVTLGRWIQWRWDKFRSRPTWIDQKMQDAVNRANKWANR